MGELIVKIATLVIAPLLIPGLAVRERTSKWWAAWVVAALAIAAACLYVTAIATTRTTRDLSIPGFLFPASSAMAFLALKPGWPHRLRWKYAPNAIGLVAYLATWAAGIVLLSIAGWMTPKV
ncbi:MAG: hypothetical protein IPK07_16270 [Deltaproteobacteria bacterium]|nr:hypothetical protein [Deltaproteobacteria bacterium]